MLLSTNISNMSAVAFSKFMIGSVENFVVVFPSLLFFLLRIDSTRVSILYMYVRYDCKFYLYILE